MTGLIARLPVQAARIAISLALAVPLLAQEPATDPRAVQPERPTVATHAHTVAPEMNAGMLTLSCT